MGAAGSLLGGCGSSVRRSSHAHTAATATSSTPATTTSTPQFAPVSAERSRAATTQRVPYRNCDTNVQAKAGTTTCAFALNAFYEYYTKQRPARMDVWSPAAGHELSTRCSGANLIVCRTADGGRVRFAVRAIEAYTQASAQAYGASANLGPDQAKSRRSAPSASGAPSQSSTLHQDARVCYSAVDLPAVTLPAVTLPAVTLPAVTIPAASIDGTHYPAQHYPAQHYPAQHYPAQHYPAQHYNGGCFDAPKAFAPQNTSMLPAQAYDSVDPSYSPTLTTRYWSAAGTSTSPPDPAAPGFGEFNAAGFPKNQYVRPYVRSDGTYVSSYWRNSPDDGLPTCKVISC